MKPYRLANGCRYPLDAPSPRNVLRLEYGALPSVLEMRRNGILVDSERLRSLSARLSEEMDSVRDRMRSLLGREINPLSPAQISLALSSLGITGLKSTQEESLLRARLDCSREASEFIGLVLRYRQLSKYRNTYVESLPQSVGSDGRVRGKFNPLGTVTGRMSCEAPNLQNIPVRTDLGMAIRSCFVASPGCVLVSHDLSQIEMRIAAHLSGDAKLSHIFATGQDIHRETAAALFRIPGDQVDPHKHRLPAKTLGFAVLYGVTPSALRDQILAAGGPEWSVEDCHKFIQRWYEIYHGVARWMDMQHSRVRRLGMLWDQFGRHRVIPGARSAIKRVVAKSLREAGNFPIQAQAAGIVKTAMYLFSDLRRVYEQGGKVCRVLMQIHDELVHEVSEDIAEEFAYAGRVLMSQCVPMSVPVESSSSVARSFDKLK